MLFLVQIFAHCLVSPVSKEISAVCASNSFFFFIGCFACYLNYIEEALNAEVLENSSHEIYFFHS